MSFNDASSIQHAYTNTSMPMNNNLGQTNMVSLANHYVTYYDKSFSNKQLDVPSFYLSSTNSQYMEQNMPVKERTTMLMLII
jgi:hypothetical protein